LNAFFAEKSDYFLFSDASALKIEEVCDVLSGKRIPKGETFCSHPTEYRYITVSDMGEKYVCSDNLQYISEHTEKQISRYKVKGGDIIISVAGTLGKLNIITSDLGGVNLTENCDRFTNFRGVGSEYLYYVLSSDLIQSQIESSKTKNGQPKLALERIRNFTIPVPHQEIQEQLVKVMISLDQYIASQLAILDRYCVADGLFCREIDGLFCRSSPDIIVRRRCVLSHKRRGWLQPSPSFRYSRNLALQDELYHPVINNGPAVLVCVDKRLGTGPVNQSRDAG